MIDALIQGKLIKAPESRTTKTGKPMASFSVNQYQRQSAGF